MRTCETSLLDKSPLLRLSFAFDFFFSIWFWSLDAHSPRSGTGPAFSPFRPPTNRLVSYYSPALLDDSALELPLRQACENFFFLATNDCG